MLCWCRWSLAEKNTPGTHTKESSGARSAAWMSRRLVSTAVLTSVMTANTSLPRKQPKRCIRRTSQREGRTATWTAHAGPGGHFFLWTPTNAPTRAKKCRHCGVKSAEEMIIHRNDLIIVMHWVWVGSQKVEPMRGTRRFKNGRAQSNRDNSFELY